MSRILCIGRDAGFCEALAESLRREARHDCMHVPTGAEGLAAARDGRPDLVILAWALPDMPGTEVCMHLQKVRSLPVVFVADEANEEERVRGFLAGATDFVVMPMSMREIALRAQAILRRVDLARHRTNITFGGLRIDRDARQVWVSGQEVAVSRLELDLLLALYEARGRGLSREDLRVRAWGRSTEVRLRVIDRCVKRLRDKLGTLGTYIETVRGVGYRLTCAPEMPGQAGRSGVQPAPAARRVSGRQRDPIPGRAPPPGP